MIKNLSDNLDRCLIESHQPELPEKWDGKSEWERCIALVSKNGNARQYVLGKRGDKNTVHYTKVWDALLITEVLAIYPYSETDDDSLNIPYTRAEITSMIKEIDKTFDLRTLRTKADIDVYRLYKKMLSDVDGKKIVVNDKEKEVKEEDKKE